jgi:TolB protein
MALTDAICAKCHVPRPRWPPVFEETARRFAQLKSQFQAGQLDAAAYEAALHELMVEHEDVFWTLGAEMEIWYRHDGAQWVQDTPPTVAGDEQPTVAGFKPAATTGKKGGLPVGLLLGGGVVLVMCALAAIVGGGVLWPRIKDGVGARTPTLASRTPAVAVATPTEKPATVAPTESPTPMPTLTKTPPTTPVPERIVFTSERDENAEIYVMNPDGSGQRNLTHEPSQDYYPRISPEGARISYHSYPPGVGAEGATEIFVLEVNTGRKQMVNTGIANAKFADWSPDGQKLVFSGESDKSWNLYIVDLTTSATHQLTEGPESDLFPAWAPDGNTIAFSRDDGTDREIFVIDVEGGNLRNLSNSPGWDWHPSWSPDGRKLAFTGERTGTRQIYVMNTDGSRQKQLTNELTFQNMEPKWNPDGNKIIFSSKRDSNWEIYVMNNDGTNMMQLTSNGVPDYNPYWR